MILDILDDVKYGLWFCGRFKGRGRIVASLLKEMKFQPQYNLCVNNIEWTKKPLSEISDVKYVFIFVNKNELWPFYRRKLRKDLIIINCVLASWETLPC